MDDGWQASPGTMGSVVLLRKTRQEVQRQRLSAPPRSACGLSGEHVRQTVAQYLERWPESTAQHRVRPTTYRRYAQLVRGPMRSPRLETHPNETQPSAFERSLRRPAGVGSLPPRSVQFSPRRSARCAPSGAPLEPDSSSNPADAVRAPRPQRHQIRSRLTTSRPGGCSWRRRVIHWRLLYVLAVMVGMRQGEMLGLGWEDRLGRGTASGASQPPVAPGGRRWSLDEPDRTQPPNDPPARERYRRTKSAPRTAG